MDSGLFTILAAILGFVAVAGVGFEFAGNGDASAAKAAKRAQGFGQAQNARDSRARVRAVATADNRRKQIIKSLKDQDKQEKKARLTLASRLMQAGLAPNVTQFWIISAVVGALVFAVALVLSHNGLIGLGAGFIAGLGLPRWVIGFLAGRRMKKFSESFSDAMDVITRGIKSGLPVHDCLKIIGRELPEPLAGEFRRLVENIGMGMSMEQALEKQYERTPTNELRFFSIVMSVQSKTGGNLAEALGNLATVLRARKLMREKIKALSSEATASAMIIGSLPPGVVVLITVTTPSYMAPMFHDPRGQVMLMGGVFWMSMGIFVMRRMINFKF